MAQKSKLLNLLRQRRGRLVSSRLKTPEINFDTNTLCNPNNRDQIANNIKRRKGIGDIDKILKLSSSITADNFTEKATLISEMSKIPNSTHPKVVEYGNKGKIVKECGQYVKKHFTEKPFVELAKSLKLLRTEDLGPIAGEKSYVLLGDLAQLEEALIQYTIRRLTAYGFRLISVPDILPTKVIERCGMLVNDERTLVYSLDNYYGDDFSLSGTAEMALATKLVNSKIEFNNLPLKLAAVSRCFRAEISNSAEEQGIYRVHQFAKVEMFICTDEKTSHETFEKLTEIQETLFSDLGLSFKVIDMPSHELGAPAYRKIDMEAWLPGKQIYGEISSCSNCTDYQSRRLNITYRTKEGVYQYVHTLNGTACAIPRMLIAICENFQQEDGTIEVPKKLIPFMKCKSLIEKQKIPDMRDYKYKIKR